MYNIKIVGVKILKQNIYDNEDFYKNYLHMRETSSGLNDVLEIPALRALLPALQGKRILDLGCGYGESCQWYLDQGAANVIGVDISKNMIKVAKKHHAQENIQYLQLPIEDIYFQNEQFDLVLSSLAFHYIEHIKPVFAKIYKYLRPGGYLIFSQEHPIATAKKIPDGWVIDEKGKKQYWILDNYQEEGIRKQHWFIDGVVKYHRTVSTLINTLIDTGFSINRIIEPIAIETAEKERIDLKNERKRPPFIIIKVRKP
jgi:2-polyprenyl-3-methyl-5-hydroxy-6-metoxy-1,4-benzoquinol methylase